MRVLSSVLFILYSLIFTNSNALDCPSLEVNESSSHYDLLSHLTHPCRYDTMSRPSVGAQGGPLLVRARMSVYYLQMTHSTNLQFKVQMLIQFHWQDKRLSYHNISHFTELVGQRPMLGKVWFPHIFVSNEDESNIMGVSYSDQVISIMPHGDVFFSTRLHTQLICQIEEGHFPFDHQTCHLVMDNLRYNLSFIELQWESQRSLLLPSALSSLTEFDLISVDTTTSEDLEGIGEGFITFRATGDCGTWSKSTHEGSNNDSSCGVRKSSLIVIFHFARKFAFYFWDYYVPSVLLVTTSWGTFWVDPEVVPCRVWLATCTMLGFFGLGAMNDALPKLSHLEMNNVWFIGCNLFIFLSLAEFAFVNRVHRQETKNIPLKRVSSKYILKSSLRTENIPWKHKSSSCPSSPELRQQRKSALAERRGQQKSVAFDLAMEDLGIDVKMRRQLSRRRQAFTGTHMTNQEMANWIDRRSRIIFPLAFFVFNLIFWSIMLI